MKKYILAAIGCMLLFASCASGSAGSDLVVDFRIDMSNTADSYFNWTYDGKETQDSYDATTGASAAKSTVAFDAVRYDSEKTKKATIPEGLRSLAFFSMASEAVVKHDAFIITGDSASFVITFVHRGTASQITVVNGKMNLATSFKIAAGLCDNVDGYFVIKDEFLKTGGDNTQMTDLDWSKISLVPDTAAADASRKFSGDLNASYKNSILVVAGTLTQK